MAINRQHHSSRGYFGHLIWIAGPLAIFRHFRDPNLPLLPKLPKSPISPKSPLSKGPLLAFNLNGQPSGNFPPLHAFLDISVSARSNLGSVPRKSLNNNNRDQVLWACETEHPSQTLVFTKTAGRQPGLGHCYLKSSQCPPISMRPRSFPPGVPRAHRNTRGWRLSLARTMHQ